MSLPAGRSAALLSCVAALVVAGCGGSDPPTTKGPPSATFSLPQTTASTAPEPKCLPAGKADPSGRGRDVRIAGLDAAPKRRPRTLEVAREITLECLVWSSFGDASATATGQAAVLDCVPSCAQSGSSIEQATLAVSGLKRCRGRRFYGEAKLTVGTGGTAESLKAVVRSPCDGGPVGA